ncbi:centrosomin-like [Diabrotica undecimpunctata]|uniref:centrosomin-like n=1 Tax=Diabrotica undecimpunctata TaxID=50387 RepID=UPI003B639DD9
MELTDNIENSDSKIFTFSSHTSSDCGDGDFDTDEITNVRELSYQTSFMRPRSTMEFEEELSNLKKENFNLKLRIYFLEEKMGSSFTLDKDNVVKQYIELQVSYANLKEELREKQDLLCQAVKAIEIDDNEHKKYVANKDEQLFMLQQEIEELRTQLQDTKYEIDGGYFSSNTTNNTNNELEQKIRILEQELQLEKENNASLQFVISQIETLKSRCDNMHKELQAKEAILETLKTENIALNSRISTYAIQMKDTQQKLDFTFKENQKLTTKIILDRKKFDELLSNYKELNSNYSYTKAELERERKELETMKLGYDKKICELEKENNTLRLKIRDLRLKLDASLTEIKKNQNLAFRTQQHLQELRKRTHYMYK